MEHNHLLSAGVYCNKLYSCEARLTALYTQKYCSTIIKQESRFNPRWQLNITQPLAHSPSLPRRDREEDWKKINPMDSDKNSLIIQIKFIIIIAMKRERERPQGKQGMPWAVISTSRSPGSARFCRRGCAVIATSTCFIQPSETPQQKGLPRGGTRQLLHFLHLQGCYTESPPGFFWVLEVPTPELVYAHRISGPVPVGVSAIHSQSGWFQPPAVTWNPPPETPMGSAPSQPDYIRVHCAPVSAPALFSWGLTLWAMWCTQASEQGWPSLPHGWRQSPSSIGHSFIQLASCENGVEFLSVGSGVRSAHPLCLRNCPLQTAAATFLEKPPLVLIFHCNSCRAEVEFPSLSHVISVDLEKNRVLPCCAPSISSLDQMTLSVTSWDSGPCMWGFESISSLSCSTSFSTAGTREEEIFCVLLELGSHWFHHWCLFMSPDNTTSELVYDDGALWCTCFWYTVWAH